MGLWFTWIARWADDAFSEKSEALLDLKRTRLTQNAKPKTEFLQPIRRLPDKESSKGGFRAKALSSIANDFRERPCIQPAAKPFSKTP